MKQLSTKLFGKGRVPNNKAAKTAITDALTAKCADMNSLTPGGAAPKKTAKPKKDSCSQSSGFSHGRSDLIILIIMMNHI